MSTATLPVLSELSPRVPGSALARFFELRGRRTIASCGALWYMVPGRFLMSLPYEAMLDPDPGELRHMIREAGARGARFPSLTWSGLQSGLYLLRRGPYDLSTLHIKHRPRVRRALEHFEVRPAEKSELLAQARALNLSTMARQGRFDPEFADPEQWETFVEAAFACPEMSFPAAFDGDRMAAYMVTCREGGWLHILHQMSRQEDLVNFPNHLLTYAVSKTGAGDPSLEGVCYGCMPLFSADGLHEYKLRFGYQAIPHRSVIQLDPKLDFVLNRRIVRSTVHLARRCFPHNQQFETIETVLEGARISGPFAARSQKSME
ncbi:MAG: hypothetical protein LAO79_18755 [Acidobacteriia bacterium]|nr:hypothetical protein [Terriglobia bacterium]